MVICPVAHLLPHGIQMGLHDFQGQLGANQKLHVMAVQVVDVAGAEEAAVQDNLDLLITQGVHVRQKLPQCFHIGNVSRQLPVIKRQA